jgi:hypothetical protein
LQCLVEAYAEFRHFLISSDNLSKQIAEDEDDRIEMNQAGSAKTVGLLQARV